LRKKKLISIFFQQQKKTKLDSYTVVVRPITTKTAKKKKQTLFRSIEHTKFHLTVSHNYRYSRFSLVQKNNQEWDVETEGILEI
jgi:hypothetical protein